MADKKGLQKTPETPEKKSRKKIILIIAGAVTLLLLLVGSAIGLYFFLTDDEEEKKPPASEVPVPQLNKENSIGPMVNIDEFIVNIISAENNHYVKASFTLELSDEFVKEEVTQRMPQIRDAILLLVGNKTYDELQDLQGKKQLKAEITSKLNAILQSGRIKSIYFTEFVVQ